MSKRVLSLSLTVVLAAAACGDAVGRGATPPDAGDDLSTILIGDAATEAARRARDGGSEVVEEEPHEGGVRCERCDDAAADGGRTPLSPPPDAGPYTCPSTATSRDVGAHRSALPAIVWNGAGYTLVLDEIVSESPFVADLYIEQTDAQGNKLKGPIAVVPGGGQSGRFWPSVAFNGWEYAVAYLDGSSRLPTWSRVDRSLVPVAGSVQSLVGAGATAVQVAWSPVGGGAWGLTWSVGSSPGQQLWFQAFDASGTPWAPAKVIGPAWIAESSTAIVGTANGWGIASTGYPSTLYEVDGALAVRSVTLPFSSVRAGLATDGTQYAIVGGDGGGHFVRVQMGGGIVAGTSATFGGAKASIPNVAFQGGTFIVSWSDSYAGTPQPLKYARVPTTFTGASFGGGVLTTLSNAGFHHLAAAPCGFAVVYGTFSATAFERLDVRP